MGKGKKSIKELIRFALELYQRVLCIPFLDPPSACEWILIMVLGIFYLICFETPVCKKKNKKRKKSARRRTKKRKSIRHSTQQTSGLLKTNLKKVFR